MNVISKSDVFAENKLFATLDTTVTESGDKKHSFFDDRYCWFYKKTTYTVSGVL